MACWLALAARGVTRYVIPRGYRPRSIAAPDVCPLARASVPASVQRSASLRPAAHRALRQETCRHARVDALPHAAVPDGYTVATWKAFAPPAALSRRRHSLVPAARAVAGDPGDASAATRAQACALDRHGRRPALPAVQVARSRESRHYANPRRRRRSRRG